MVLVGLLLYRGLRVKLASDNTKHTNGGGGGAVLHNVDVGIGAG